ncbi:MAG: hypothetical protein FWG64_00020 [Firmicutes bacterium]|nr:hypothetical protein [Bacillota bacterium]
MKKSVKCYLCEAETERAAVLISEKLLHKSAATVYCLDCLSDYLDMTKEALFEKWAQLSSVKH